MTTYSFVRVFCRKRKEKEKRKEGSRRKREKQSCVKEEREASTRKGTKRCDTAFGFTRATRQVFIPEDTAKKRKTVNVFDDKDCHERDDVFVDETFSSMILQAWKTKGITFLLLQKQTLERKSMEITTNSEPYTLYKKRWWKWRRDLKTVSKS